MALVALAAAKGSKIVIADLRLTDPAKQLLQKNASNIRFLQCDVTKWADLEAVVPFAGEHFGDVPDVYVAAAGIMETVCKPSAQVTTLSH